MIIRPEQIVDYEQIAEVNRLAFGRETEARLVERLRDAPEYHPELSLVAVDGNQIIGHILFSLIAIDSHKGWIPALALAPLAVIPNRQYQGVGSALVEQGIQVCYKLGHRIIVVLGHADYYPHFGFQRASKFEIYCSFAVPDEAFMVLGLGPNALKDVKGTVVYPEPFSDV